MWRHSFAPCPDASSPLEDVTRIGGRGLYYLLMKSFVPLLVTAAALAVPASAQTIVFNDFSSVAGLQLNGNALQAGNALRLTSAGPNQSGSVFSTTTVNLASDASFSTFFTFRITESGGISDLDGTGADGITFTVQTVSNTAGGAGGGIGYLGIGNSVAVEFDTWDNGTGLGDPNGNHVNFDYNGSFSSAAGAVGVANRMNNGSIWSAWVDYNGATDGLELRLAENSIIRPGAPLLATVVDLTSVLGTTNAFVGFTSGTGAAWGNHDILSWQFRGTYDPIIDQPGAVPEPSTYGLFAAAALAAGIVIRRRRAKNA